MPEHEDQNTEIKCSVPGCHGTLIRRYDGDNWYYECSDSKCDAPKIAAKWQTSQFTAREFQEMELRIAALEKIDGLADLRRQNDWLQSFYDFICWAVTMDANGLRNILNHLAVNRDKLDRICKIVEAQNE